VRGRIAYLVSQFPALSHTFIEREVESLRRRGWAIDIFSVRRATGNNASLSVARSDAVFTLVDVSTTRFLRSQIRMLVHHPVAWFHGLAAASWTAGSVPHPRALIRRLAYFLEAVVLLCELRRRGVRHIHVHFANNAAEVARLGTIMAEHQAGYPRLTYSITMHGLGMHGLDNSADMDWPHRNEQTWGRLRDKLEAAAFVVCISSYTRDQLANLVGSMSQARLEVVHMGIDPDHYSFSLSPSERLEKGAAPTRLLFVGRLSEEKRPSLLVEAVQRLRDNGTPVELLIAGLGPLEEFLRARVAAAHLTRQVVFLGGVSQLELPGLYRSADIFCLTSVVEGVPVVLMEAMASGLPIVATDITGIPELVIDGETGLLVKPGDVEEIVDRLHRLIKDPGLGRSLATAARRHVESSFCSATEVVHLEHLLSNYVDPPAAGLVGRDQLTLGTDVAEK
jgi:colanic acid/amylovoran biosynthesis glycosyltransferase